MFITILIMLLSPGLALAKYSCETTYETLDIPAVKAESREEFYFCFGLHHGKDRAWEMDYFRRLGQGRNAEVHGFSQLKSDLMMRLLDLPSFTQKIWQVFPKDQRKWLELYADGVNEGFKTGKSTREFRDLSYEPEPWKPEDSLLVLLLQSFDQTRKTFFQDYEEEKIKSKWGSKASILFDEDDVPWGNTILKNGEYPTKEEVAKVTSTKILPPLSLWGEFPTVFGKESGSNNWAVSHRRSKTGKAWFANDPHLDLKTPMFWYWISLTTSTTKVIGASVPGVPVIASGTNGKVVWGLTNSYLNSADAVFVEDLSSEDVESFRPLVKVKFWFLQLPFFFKSFEKLKSGHKVLPLDTEGDRRLVLRWTGFDLIPEDIYPMFELPEVTTVQEMDQVTSKIGVPSWNFVFADTKGEIGYRMVGKTFKHEEKLPLGIPVVRKETLNEKNFLSSDEKPHLLKPLRNYVYSANNRHWPADAKFYGGRGYSHSFRGHRIDELIRSGEHDFESFKKIQCDRQAVDAKFFLPKIQKHLKTDIFQGWEMTAEEDSKIHPIYRRLMDLLKEKWEVNEYALFRMLDSLNEKKITELKELFTRAQRETGGRTWGEMLRVRFAHMSKNEGWVFSPDLSGIGDTHSVDPGTALWNPEKKIYEQFSGASMRLIVEMDKIPRIWLALPGLNRSYDQRTDEAPWRGWRNCEYTEIKF